MSTSFFKKNCPNECFLHNKNRKVLSDLVIFYGKMPFPRSAAVGIARFLRALMTAAALRRILRDSFARLFALQKLGPLV